MGFIAQLAGSSKQLSEAVERGRASWREFAGMATDKERGSQVRSQAANSYGRSAATQAAQMRLLQALRSGAPGGWSDDRFEQSKHFVCIQYACIHRSGEQLMQAEFALYQKDPNHPDGKRPVLQDEPAHNGRFVRPYQLIELLEKPNPDDSFGDLMYRWNQQLDLTGTALTWMVPNQLGTPYELYCIATAVAIPQPVVNPEYPHGFYRIQPVYHYGPFSRYPTPNSAVGAPIPAQWMLKFQYPHPFLRYEGYSPQTAMRLHLDEIEMIDRSRHYAMRRGIHPSAVLNMEDVEGIQPLPYEEILRIKADFEETQMGPENFGQLFVAAPGSKLEEWGTRPLDMDYQSGWDQLVMFAMGAGFGTPKPIVGMLNDVNYATLFATLKQFHLLTLQPKCNRIAAKLTRHLAPFFGDDLILEIRVEPIHDHEIIKAKVESLVSAGAITKNEVRKEFDMPVTTEAWGEEMAGTISAAGGVSNAIQKSKKVPAMIDPKTGGVVSDRANIEKPSELEEGKPKPGPLGRGSLGPRKHLNGVLRNGRK